MPSLAPNSTCSICFEPFDAGSRKPCATLCGHIFCYDCFCNIRGEQQRCPNCRSDMRTVVELHLDIDDTPQPSQSPTRTQLFSRSRSSNKAEERRLLSEIDNVSGLLATSSVDADEVQNLLSRCQAFLQSHRAEQFPGLLTSYHVLRRSSEMANELESQRQIIQILQEDLDDIQVLGSDELQEAIHAGESEERHDQVVHRQEEINRDGRGRRWREGVSDFMALVRRRGSKSPRPFEPLGLPSRSSDDYPRMEDTRPLQVLASYPTPPPSNGLTDFCPYCHRPLVGHHACAYTPSGSRDNWYSNSPRRSDSSLIAQLLSHDQ
ncbi:peroxisome biogenesis factor 10 [Stygiomarasmius scandens]|uniref:Peroxisome biogenesis factor 10 n=1 Tax=Marasmiellus scandens TaxID=2682957 RepID=A0ABR1JCR4_9AGAR